MATPRKSRATSTFEENRTNYVKDCSEQPYKPLNIEDCTDHVLKRLIDLEKAVDELTNRMSPLVELKEDVDTNISPCEVIPKSIHARRLNNMAEQIENLERKIIALTEAL